jgi:CRP/FNR family transcriptional regulator, cyclic AMP receptor protein
MAENLRDPRGSKMTYPDDSLTRRWPAGLVRRVCSTTEIAELLTGTSWVDSFAPDEIPVLARYLYVCEAAEGATIVQEGRHEAYLCLLVKGRVSIFKEGPDGKTIQLGTASAGSTFGEMSLIDGEPRSASVVADEPALLVVLTGQGLEDLSTEMPQLAVKVLLKVARVLSERLRDTSGALVDSSRGNSSGVE